jgi:hypothetical protein
MGTIEDDETIHHFRIVDRQFPNYHAAPVVAENDRALVA